MARLGVVCVALLCVCSAGQAQESPDLSAITFWPRPLSEAPLRLDPQGVAGNGDATSASARRGRARREAGDNEPPGPTREALSGAVEKRLDSVSEEAAENGERSSALIDDLTSLAALYEKLGQHDSAIAALEDAIDVIRINYGLYSLEQVGAVESLVENQEAAGQYAQAAEQRRYLRELIRRNAGDPRIVGILTGFAAAEMESAHSLLGVRAPPEISVSVREGPASPSYGVRPGPRLRPALAALYSARRDYATAIKAAVEAGSGNVADLFALEDAIVDTVYFEVAHPELHNQRGRPAFVGALGVDVLKAKVTNSVNFNRTGVEVAKALIELGDWYLLVAANGMALDQYRAAHDLLVMGGVPRDTLDEILSPEIPPVLPVLPPGVADPGRERAPRGYIDAAVTLNRYGGVRTVEVIDASPGTSRAIEHRLRQYVNLRRFRPRFADDELIRNDEFTARFYYDY